MDGRPGFPTVKDPQAVPALSRKLFEANVATKVASRQGCRQRPTGEPGIAAIASFAGRDIAMSAAAPSQ